MELNIEQADYLLGIKKKIVFNGETPPCFTINMEMPFHIRIEVISSDDEYTFIWEIKQNRKNTMRMSLHYQENDSHIGLFRIDYNSGHINPAEASDLLPDRFREYIGAAFDNTTDHVHYHVDGYKTLAWAIPITDIDFSVKKLGVSTFWTDLSSAIKEFAKLVNIETHIEVNELII